MGTKRQNPRKPSPKKKAGRPARKPERYSPSQVAEALRVNRGNASAAARVLGCHWDTVHRYCEIYPVVREARDCAINIRLDGAEAALDQAIADGEGWAICFFLKTRGKSRGYVERSEVVTALEVIPPYIPGQRD